MLETRPIVRRIIPERRNVWRSRRLLLHLARSQEKKEMGGCGMESAFEIKRGPEENVYERGVIIHGGLIVDEIRSWEIHVHD